MSIIGQTNVVHGYNRIYLGLKINEILTLAITWMKFKGNMLSEISQKQRKLLYEYTYMRNLQQIYGDRKWNGFCQEMEEEDMGNYRLMGTDFQF